MVAQVIPLQMPEAMQRRIDMLRAAAGYFDATTKPYLMELECSAIGHPAKYDGLPELKSESKRGCICGRDPVK